VQFVKDYLRVRDPESPYHEEQKVTDPVCQMTFSIIEAACSTKFKDRTYYFCVEGCRRRFEATPERYVEQTMSINELPGHERSPLLNAAPGAAAVRSRETNPAPQRHAFHRQGEA
jgi:YHS domain-containing protein